MVSFRFKCFTFIKRVNLDWNTFAYKASVISYNRDYKGLLMMCMIYFIGFQLAFRIA